MATEVTTEQSTISPEVLTIVPELPTEVPTETIVGSPTVDEETHMLDPTLHTEDPLSLR